MEYKYPTFPEPDLVTFDGADYGEEFAKEIWYYTDEKLRQYAEQAVAPLLAEIERLKRGEFICNKCGLRKDAEMTKPDF